MRLKEDPFLSENLPNQITVSRSQALGDAGPSPFFQECKITVTWNVRGSSRGKPRVQSTPPKLRRLPDRWVFRKAGSLDTAARLPVPTRPPRSKDGIETIEQLRSRFGCLANHVEQHLWNENAIAGTCLVDITSDDLERPGVKEERSV